MKQKPKPPKPPVPGSPSWIKQALLGIYGIVGVALSTFGGFKLPFAESNAKDYWRHALAGVVLVVALLASVVSLAIYLFNANYFKSQIIDYVKTTTQRDLTLDGDLTVSFFPKLALDAGKMTLSQRNSKKSFASIESGHFHIAWLPLFLKQLQVESVSLEGVHANITRYRNGSTNLDDFVSGEGNISDIKFEIDSIKLNNSSVSLQDEISGYFVSLHDLSLETGKMANNVPADITSNFRIDSAKPRMDGKVKLSSHLLFDLKTGSYELANMEGVMNGEISGLSNLALSFQGSIKGNLKQSQMTIDKVAVNAKGMLDKRKFDARFDLPGLSINKNTMNGSKFTFNGSLLQEDENLNTSLEIPAFGIDGNTLKADTVTGNIDLFKSGRTLQGKFSTTLNADLDKRAYSLAGISGNLAFTHPALNGKLSASLNGDLKTSFAEQNLKLNFKTRVDENNFSGSFSMQNFAQAAYNLELTGDKLDLDRYLVSDWSKRLLDHAQPFDFSALKDWTLHGKFRMNELRFAKLKATSVSGEASIDQSMLSLDLSAARLYGGNLSGSLGIDARNTPLITLKQKFNNVQIGSLLADFTGGESRLSGKGTANIDVNGSGDNLGAWYKSLNGSASLAFSHGAISGISLTDTLLASKLQLGTPQAKYTATAKFTDSTAFAEMKSGFEIAAGVAKTGDFLLKSPVYAVKGEGEIALESGQLQYQLTAAIATGLKRSNGEIAELKGVSLPLQVSGPYNNPTYTLELEKASGMKPARAEKTKPEKPTKTLKKQK